MASGLHVRVWMLTQGFAEWQHSRAKPLEQGLAHSSTLSPLSILCFPFSSSSLTGGCSPALLIGHTRPFIVWPCLPFESSSLLPSTPSSASTLFLLGYFCALLWRAAHAVPHPQRPFLALFLRLLPLQSPPSDPAAASLEPPMG